MGVAVDGQGNVYAVDGINGSIGTFPGGYRYNTSSQSGFTSPRQIAVDTAGNLYLASGTQILKIPFTNGSINYSGQTSVITGLGSATGVAVDTSGNIYAVDNTNKNVIKLAGSTKTTIMSSLSSPQQIAVDRLGNIYVADPGCNCIDHLPSGGSQSTFTGGFTSPNGVAVDFQNNL